MRSLIFFFEDYLYRNKKTILSLLIFLLPMVFLALPFLKWGFITDDFVILYHSKIKNLCDFFKFFNEGSAASGEIAGSSSLYEAKTVSSFLNVYYRPLFFIIVVAFTHFLKTYAYAYLVLTIIFHAINCLLLFFILNKFFTLNISFLVSLFFAFHLSLFSWIGLLNCLHYNIDLFLFFLIIIFLYYFIKLKKIYFWIISLFLYLIVLFLRETFIFLPFWFFITGFLFKDKLIKLIKLGKFFLFLGGYLLIDIFYFLTRLYFFPLTKSSHALSFQLSFDSFIKRQLDRFYDFVSFAVDILNISFIGGGHKLLKFTLVIIVSFLLFYPFIKSKKIGLFGYLFFSLLLFSWPAVLIAYQPRYIYAGLIFFIAIFAYSLNFYLNTFIKYKKYIYSFIFLILLFNISFLIYAQKQKEYKLNVIASSFENLAKDLENTNKTICFIGLPLGPFTGGNRQAILLYKKGPEKPVFYDKTNFVDLYSLFPEKNLAITKIDNGFNIKSLDPDKVWFVGDKTAKVGLGEFIINKVNSKNFTVEFDYIFDKKLLDLDPIFVTWDYKDLKFKILD